MILPTTYWGTIGWWECFRATGEKDVQIEVMESFPKQTCRNRCTILDATGHPLVLSVPVKKVESKQYTRDVEISYQTRWQHQHWMAILSAYKKTPYFDYYQDYLRPLYERETRWLIELNDWTFDIVHSLLHNQMPDGNTGRTNKTSDWAEQNLENRWGNEICILDALFRLGPEAILQLTANTELL
ncbi:MAG: WbqC family protein [Paludibacteraceae bacterium]|nr:WbqC family protein [Paludibacteraceae bacterium]